MSYLTRPMLPEDICDYISKFIKNHKSDTEYIKETITNALNNKCKQIENDLLYNDHIVLKKLEKLIQKQIDEYIGELNINYLLNYVKIKNKNHEYVCDICFKDDLLILENLKSYKNAFLWNYNSPDKIWLKNIIKSDILTVNHNYLINIDTFIIMLYLDRPDIMIDAEYEKGESQIELIKKAIKNLKRSIDYIWNTDNTHFQYMVSKDPSYTFNNKYVTNSDMPCVIIRY